VLLYVQPFPSHSLRGPNMKSVNRHVTNSAQGHISYSNSSPLVRGDISPAGDSSRKFDDKKRPPGPLVSV